MNNQTEKKTLVGTIRLLPEIREDLCCNKCQPIARTDEARDAVLADFQKKARAFYGPL